MAVVRSSVQLRYLQFDDLWSTGNNTHAHTHTSTGQDRTDMCSVSQKCHKTFCTKKKREGKTYFKPPFRNDSFSSPFRHCLPSLTSVTHPFAFAPLPRARAQSVRARQRPVTPPDSEGMLSLHSTQLTVPFRCPTTKNGSPKHTFRALSLRFEYELFDHNEPLHCEAVL